MTRSRRGPPCVPAERTLLLALPPRGRADRQALDRRDPARADGRARSASRRSASSCPTSPTGCCPSGMKELEARGDRRAPRDRRHARPRRVRPHRRRATRSSRSCAPLKAGRDALAIAPGCQRCSSARRPPEDRRDDRPAEDRRRRQGDRRGARHPLHPLLVHRHPRPAEELLDQRARSSTTRSRAAWASTARRSPASTRSRSRT